MEVSFDRFDKKLQATWQDILDHSPLVRLVREGNFDRDLYALYMVETFHYTAHNAKNQALVCRNLGSSNKEIQYMRFCLKHALEETGHELMAIHDIRAMGYSIQIDQLNAPLPETQALIAYLYHISETGNPLQRLGYSYWAESSYHYFGEILAKIQKTLELTPAMMTFFIEHSEIDEGHFEDIKKAITSFCKSEEDLQAIEDVMLASLRLTGSMLNGVYRLHNEIQMGKKDLPFATAKK